MIYEYTLTEYYGLIAKCELGGPIQFGIRNSENHEERDPNQLRYVCQPLSSCPEVQNDGVSYRPIPSYLGSGYTVTLRFTPTRSFLGAAVVWELGFMLVGERLHEVVKVARQVHEDSI